MKTATEAYEETRQSSRTLLDKHLAVIDLQITEAILKRQLSAEVEMPEDRDLCSLLTHELELQGYKVFFGDPKHYVSWYHIRPSLEVKK